MIAGHSNEARYRAILARDSQFDGVFYFAKATGLYCYPSCPAPHPLEKSYAFFTTAREAALQGYHACKRCALSDTENTLSTVVLEKIDTGAISDDGVSGLANALHISERHLRRIVHKRTGSSPVHFNQEKRLTKAMLLITSTRLPIIDVAFNAGFSSLRQFNSVFKQAFQLSPREMRKTAAYAPNKGVEDPVTYLSKTPYLQPPVLTPLHH